ncbi:unnamed protein product [Diatraea saccharalis]|uniref:tRNA-5-taurinomethyluridine 2-sulfurtransferase n=1 Tax=Diatraea saccharalis TaxID=40085 RepID=A0A9N9R2H2_9NEOP|nr:unnamed protein product [Diatraea saccharalis]
MVHVVHHSGSHLEVSAKRILSGVTYVQIFYKNTYYLQNLPLNYIDCHRRCVIIMFRKVAVGISGGVDSAVAAFLLKGAGFQVEGVFMRNWDNNYEAGYCSDEKDFEDAMRNLAVDAIATGHYANTSFGPFLEKYSENEGVRLLQPADKHKDQTFFLSQVKPFSLRRCMFPLANILKSKVREIAKVEGLLNVANKKDSTGICFIGKKNFQDFIEEYIETKKGLFIDIDSGKEVGKHSGLHKWTVGQRCCLANCKQAYFVFKKDLESNNIYVVAGTSHTALWNKLCFTDNAHWIYSEPPDLHCNNVLECYFRFQHTKPLVPCKVVKNYEGLTIILKTNLRAITEGQYGVLYKNGECLGSAKIKDICHNLKFSHNY